MDANGEGIGNYKKNGERTDKRSDKRKDKLSYGNSFRLNLRGTQFLILKSKFRDYDYRNCEDILEVVKKMPSEEFIIGLDAEVVLIGYKIVCQRCSCFFDRKLKRNSNLKIR
ncbi:hypothetical protein AGMMS49573_07110 [Endomicrobiia bacterium]|nr:hypothetical protein AGMMS49573_07110 [Endomicrobiia bacterium]